MPPLVHPVGDQPRRLSHLPRPLILTLLTTIFVTVVSWIPFLRGLLLGHVTGEGWPYYFAPGMPWPQNDRFGDLLLFRRTFEHFGKADFFKQGMLFPYPAPMAWLYRLYLPYLPDKIAIATFLATVVVVMVAGSALLAKRMERLGAPSFVVCFGYLVLSSVFSHVLAFEMRQLNAEIFAFICVAAALFFFVERRFNAAAVFFGLAIALKVYPCILLALFLPIRQYRPIGIAVLTAATTLCLGFTTVAGSFLDTARQLQISLHTFTVAYGEQISPAIGFDHSVFGACKVASRYVRLHGHEFLPICLGVTGVCAMVLFFTRIWKMPVFNRIAYVVAIAIFLPPVSFEYTLLHLYSVFAIFCCIVVRQAVASRAADLWFPAVCFGVLFGLTALRHNGAVYVGLVKAVTLLCFICWVTVCPLSDPDLDGPEVLRV